MRISAIRGRNLASLAGDFEILLDEDPLGQVGLFAITGPTGAGKSTLLDCICLALYDQIPRLQAASRNSRVRASLDEDAEALTATDPRLCLRRGTGEGYAEVEFHDAGGARYRSRWSVRRARNKASGRVQNTEMSLWAEDGSTLAGGGKREVLAAIEERVGLGFEQFLRSAMLAQGAFAAFLHAAPNDRATVLERVTGTEVYRLISQATFERFRAEQATLAGIGQRLEAVGVLTDEERDTLVQEQERLVEEAETRERAVLEASKALSWHTRDDQLTREVAEAREGVAQARADQEALAPQREALARAEALEPLRPLVDALTRAEQAQEQAATQVVACERAHREAKEASLGAQRAEAQARLLETELRSRWTAGEADRQRARGLDAAIEAARGTLEGCTRAVREARTQVGPLREALAREERRIATIAEAAAVAREWRAAHPAAEARRLQRDSLLRDLSRLDQLGASLAEGERAHETLAARTEAATTEAEALQASQRSAEGARVEAERALVVAVEAVQAIDAAQLEAEASSLAGEQAWLGRLRELARRASEARESGSRAETQAAEARGRHAELLARIQSFEAEEPLETIRLEEARHTLDRLGQAIGLEARRADLVEGEACPLCGSVDHPWREHGAPTSALLEAQRERVQALQAAQLARAAALAGARTQAGQQQAQAAEADGVFHRAQAQLAEVVEAWRDEPSVGAWTPPDTPELAAIEARAQAVLTRVEALSRSRARLVELQRDLGERRDQVDRARAEEQARIRAFQENRVLRSRLAEQLQAASHRLTELRSERSARLEDLVLLEGLAGFPEAPVDIVRAALVAEVDRARMHHTALEAEREVQASAPLQAHKARLERAIEREKEATEAQVAASERLQVLVAERNGVLGGQAIDILVRAHTQSETEARRAVERAAQDARQRGEQASACEARLEQAQAAAALAQAGQADAREALQAACRAADLSVEAVTGGLAPSPDRLDALRTQVEAGKARLARAQTVTTERERALAQHHEGFPPPPREIIEAHLGQLEQGKRAAQAQRAAVDAKLAGDTIARSKAAALTTEYADQAAILDVWSRLSDLIGSRDGRTFKRFAQSLTLDSLLSHANRHLDDLAPRYRLVRVPGSELDLQVIDRHMGDEIRGVHTLSGGESFLASLALALGLASLSSADTPVETLFIDEGFGTLDRETLDTALAALDALRAGGRQVGIISHVSGLAERIGTQVRVVPTGAGRSKVVVERG